MLDCCGNHLTTYKFDYKTRKSNNYANRATKIEQPDEPLISNYYWFPLQANGIQAKSKVWPKTTVGMEEYKDFVNRCTLILLYYCAFIGHRNIESLYFTFS